MQAPGTCTGPALTGAQPRLGRSQPGGRWCGCKTPLPGSRHAGWNRRRGWSVDTNPEETPLPEAVFVLRSLFLVQQMLSEEHSVTHAVLTATPSLE